MVALSGIYINNYHHVTFKYCPSAPPPPPPVYTGMNYFHFPPPPHPSLSPPPPKLSNHSPNTLERF